MPLYQNNDSYKLGSDYSYHPALFKITKAAQENIPFGIALQIGTLPDQSQILANPNATFIGVAAYSVYGRFANPNNEIIGYLTGDAIGVLQAGYIVVQTTTPSVSLGSPVHILSSGANKGKFQSTPTPSNSTLLKGARFINSVSPTSAIIELSGFPNFSLTPD